VVDRQWLTPRRGDDLFGPPKTSRSYRTLPLADVVLEDIARHLAEHRPAVEGIIVAVRTGSR
jgi:hypothetical protein